jgi:hypothetical protein
MKEKNVFFIVTDKNGNKDFHVSTNINWEVRKEVLYGEGSKVKILRWYNTLSKEYWYFQKELFIRKWKERRYFVFKIKWSLRIWELFLVIIGILLGIIISHFQKK